MAGMRDGYQRVDITSLLRSIDIKRVLNDLKIPYKQRLEGTELQIKCINPNHRDNSCDSLHMNARGDDYNGVFKCNPCGIKGSFIKFLQLATDNKTYEIIKYLSQYGNVIHISNIQAVLDDRNDAYELINSNEDNKKFEDKEISIVYEKIKFDNNWDLNNEAEAYLAKRRIHPVVAFNHEIGWSKNFEFKQGVFANNAIVFPIRFNGKIISYFLRCWNGNFFGDTAKLFPPGAPVGRCLYNIDNCYNGKPTIVVEGIIDALVVESSLLLYDLYDKYNVCSSYSNSATDSHVKQLSQISGDIILLPDRDSDAGVVLCERIAMKLFHSKNVFIANVPCGKDPGDCSPPEVIDAINSKEVWSVHTNKNKILYGTKYLFF